MNILLITTGVNNDKSSSWLVFSKYIDFMRRNYNANIRVVCFTPKFVNSKNNSGEKILNALLINELFINLFKRINKNYLWIVSQLYAKIYFNRINREIRIHNINKLWIYTDLLPMIILKKINEKNRLPYHLTIFDNPFTNKGFLPFYTKADVIFKHSFRNASSIDTPTSNLSSDYLTNNIIDNNCKTIESYVGIFKEPLDKPVINKSVKKIALTGSIYGNDALFAFLTAISEILIEENIEFHFLSNAPRIYINYLRKKHTQIFNKIKIKPFVPEHNIIKELQKFDLLYLPMKFDNEFRFQTNTSFPSKTHNYLASGIPIIVHTPATSAIYSFFDENHIGCIIKTLDPEEIISKFKSLLHPLVRENISHNIYNFNLSQIHNSHVNELYEAINSFGQKKNVF